MNKYLDPKRYWSFVVCKMIVLISPIIKVWERSQYKKYTEISIKHQPIFIIGAPRTGSTILYQTLTNQLDVLYIDNLACRFNKNLFFGFWLSNLFFKKKAHNCFSSHYGSTKGLHSPSECGAFWYRWLPKDRHFIDHDDVTDKMIKEIREEITAITNKYDKPIIINNNNIALRIRLVSKIFPDAKYIVCDRAPFYVAQSLILARKNFFNDIEKWWSILPREYEEIHKEKPSVQVVNQHYYINKQMYKDLKKIVDRSAYQVINYSRFAHNSEETVKLLAKYFGGYGFRADFEENKVLESKSVKLDESLVVEINDQIKRLDWDDYKS